MYWRRPLTRLETGIYAALIGIFITVFASYILEYMEVAERVAMEATLINTSASINLKMAQAFLSQRPNPKDVIERNPFEVAGASPPNFARNADPSSLEPGQWAYDKERSEIVYLPRLRSNLHAADGERALRFRLVRTGTGYTFQPSRPFKWE